MNPEYILIDLRFNIMALVLHGRPSELLLLRMNKEIDTDMKYMNSYVLSTLHEKRKIKIYITKKDQIKSEKATNGTLL